MFRRPIRCPRDGIGLKDLCLVSFVIVQNGIRGPRQAFAIVDVWIRVHRHHVGPLIEIFLLCRRELVLIVLRPAGENNQRL